MLMHLGTQYVTLSLLHTLITMSLSIPLLFTSLFHFFKIPALSVIRFETDNREAKDKLVHSWVIFPPAMGNCDLD